MNVKLSRQERRKQARKQKTGFEPQYNGKGPISFAEYISSLKRVPARMQSTSTDVAEVSE